MTFEFEDYAGFTGPDITEELVVEAERDLGHKLPASYIDLLRIRNDGAPTSSYFRTSFPTAWAPDHFKISAICGIGGTSGIQKSEYMIKEWDYPNIGIVICCLQEGAYATVMLDYRRGLAEPEVAYIDEDRVIWVIAPTFADFIGRLEIDDPLFGSD